MEPTSLNIFRIPFKDVCLCFFNQRISCFCLTNLAHWNDELIQGFEFVSCTVSFEGTGSRLEPQSSTSCTRNINSVENSYCYRIWWYLMDVPTPRWQDVCSWYLIQTSYKGFLSDHFFNLPVPPPSWTWGLWCLKIQATRRPFVRRPFGGLPIFFRHGK